MSRDTGRQPNRILDDEIAAVIEHYDDPSHPDALTVGATREYLETIQAHLADHWDETLTSVREAELRIDADTDGVVIVHDPERRTWGELLDKIELYDSVARTVVRISHRLAATRIADTEFDGVDPLIVMKPERAEAGQRLLESIIVSCCSRGLAHDEAWAYYGIEIRGYDPDDWASAGFDGDRIALADAAERAREILGE